MCTELHFDFSFYCRIILGWMVGWVHVKSRPFGECGYLFLAVPYRHCGHKRPQGERERRVRGVPMLHRDGQQGRYQVAWSGVLASSCEFTQPRAHFFTISVGHGDTRRLMEGEANTQVVFAPETLTKLVEIDHLLSIWRTRAEHLCVLPLNYFSYAVLQPRDDCNAKRHSQQIVVIPMGALH